MCSFAVFNRCTCLRHCSAYRRRTGTGSMCLSCSRADLCTVRQNQEPGATLYKRYLYFSSAGASCVPVFFSTSLTDVLEKKLMRETTTTTITRTCTHSQERRVVTTDRTSPKARGTPASTGTCPRADPPLLAEKRKLSTPRFSHE